MRPREISSEAGGRSTLTATRASLVEVLLQVGDRVVELRLVPVLADGRHLAGALADDGRDPRALTEQRVRRDARADVALAGEAVALRAHADESLLAELDVSGQAPAMLNPSLVVGN